MRANKATVLTFAEKCKVCPLIFCSGLWELLHPNTSLSFCNLCSYFCWHKLVMTLKLLQSLLSSNWQGQLNTIKADAKGRYPFAQNCYFSSSSSSSSSSLPLYIVSHKICLENFEESFFFINSDSKHLHSTEYTTITWCSWVENLADQGCNSRGLSCRKEITLKTQLIWIKGPV